MRFQDKNVLVTGGAGFVGANLVETLSSEGAFVTVLDDMFTGNASRISNAEIVEASVADYNLVAELVRKAEFVFHLAARNIIVSTADPLGDFQANVGGTMNVLLAAKYTEVKRIIFTSSASVYGNPRHVPINEDDGCYAMNPYAAGKIASEQYCSAFYESYKVPATVLRLSNVYGPYQDANNPYCGVVAKFFDKAMKNEPPEIHGDGCQTRDFTYVEDVIEAILLAALSQKSVGEIINVGTGIETSISDLADMIVTQCIGSQPIHVDRRDIDNLRRRVLNIEKARRILGWIPMTSLREGLEKTRKWLRNEKM